MDNNPAIFSDVYNQTYDIGEIRELLEKRNVVPSKPSIYCAYLRDSTEVIIDKETYDALEKYI